MKKLNLINIKQASIELSQKTEKERSDFIVKLADVIWKQKDAIIKANKKDIKSAESLQLSKFFIQRLVLDELSIRNIVKKLYDLQNLKSNIGYIIEQKQLANGAVLKKIVTPIGIIVVIYESRPEVTIDVAALCIKSGNAAILKGGSEALQTNKILFRCVIKALKMGNINYNSVSFITSREEVYELITKTKSIDLVIARGSYGLVQAVINRSKIPVLAHLAGGARIYVDESAEQAIVENILVNAKTSKPSACNSLDTIVLHQALVERLLPHIINTLKKNNVSIIKNVWDEEFLNLKVSIKIVKDVYEAITFINLHSNKHSEGIIAHDQKIIDIFTSQVDAAAVFVNCSTRLHDGYMFGMGSEIGIATGKLHARGPVGLKELTSYKWHVYGNGQITK